jgi:hypothetical protein
MYKLSKLFDLQRIKGGCPVELAKPKAASMPETEVQEIKQLLCWMSLNLPNSFIDGSLPCMKTMQSLFRMLKQ